MALAVVDVLSSVKFEGTNKKITIADVTFDASYLADGEALTAAELQLASIDVLIADVKQGATLLDTEVFWDYANAKLIAVVGSTGVEVANAVDLSAVVASVFAVGTQEA